MCEISFVCVCACTCVCAIVFCSLCFGIVTYLVSLPFSLQKLEQVTKISGECIIVGIGEEEFYFSLLMKTAETFELMQQLTYLATKE